MRNFRRGLLVIAVMLCTNAFAWPDPPPPADLDNNGMIDTVELQLANNFKPGFILHAGRIVEPEPVEIMSSPDGTGIAMNDVYATFYDVSGTEDHKDKLCHERITPCMLGDSPAVLDGPARHGEFFETYYLEYGASGEEQGHLWEDTYINGRPGILPGSAFDPVVYPHIYSAGSNWIIQYYIFYPYNWASNAHEGDWEHIDIALTSGDPATASIAWIDFYMHHKYFRVEGNYLQKLHMVNTTHPIVYVGGWTSYRGMEGHTSGASYPATGDWNNVATIVATEIVETVSPGGAFIHPDQVRVELYPAVDRYGKPESNCAPNAYFEGAYWYRGWMRAELLFGHPEVGTPWDWIETLPVFGEEIGNNAPASPPYQDSWEHSPAQDSPDDVHMPSTNYDKLDSNVDILFVTLRDTSGRMMKFGEIGVPDNSHPEWKQEFVAAGYCRGPFVGAEKLIRVPRVILQDGETYFFAGWSDGVGSEIIERRVEDICADLPLAMNHEISARYEDGHDWVDSGSSVFGLRAGAGGAWADYDGDGLDDLFLIESASHCVLLRNTGEAFVEAPFPATDGGLAGAAWGDCDNDGDVDLCITPKPYGAFQVFKNNQGTLEAGAYVALGDGIEYGGCSWVDVDGDGDLDVIGYGDSAHHAACILINDGTGDLSPGWESLPRTMKGGAWADYDGDGDLDLCALGNTHPGSPILRNNGGQFVEDFTYLATGWDSEVFSAAWVDFDNDGDWDFQQNFDLFRCDSTGELSQTYRFPIDSTSDAIYANWADFDSDGWVDVIINGRLYRNNHGEFVDLTTRKEWPIARPGRWEWVDYDGDGDLDLFSFGSPLRLMENTEEVTGRFVKVDLHGAVGNRQGVGATLHFPIGLRPMYQNSGVANSATRGLIGVGDLSTSYSLGVTWPSRTRQTVQIAPGTQNIGVVEPTGIDQFSANALLADGLERDYVIAVRLAPPSAVANATMDASVLGGGSALPLRDDGEGADTSRGDGIYTSTSFRATLDYFQYYYPRIAADLADGTHLERLVDLRLVQQDDMLPSVATQAAYRIRAGSADMSTVLAVAIDSQAPLASVAANLTAIGGANGILLRDDGLGEDIKAGDGVYTSPAVLVEVADPGTYQTLVKATTLSGAATEQAVGVAAVASAAKFRDDGKFGAGEQVAGDLATLLSSRPYSSVLFKATPADGASSEVMVVTFDDNMKNPLLLGRTGSGSGTAHFANRDFGSLGAWLDAPLPLGSRGVCYADYDNDGDTDFFISSPMRGGKLYQNNLVTAGSFSDVTAAFFWRRRRSLGRRHYRLLGRL